VTRLRGIDYYIYTAEGKAVGLRATVPDVAMANTVSKGSEYTTFTIVEKGDNSTNKPNPSMIRFPNANVRDNPQSQDIVLYWKDAEGWHLQRAVSTSTIYGGPVTDSRLTLQYSEPWNRPTQPGRAIGWMGEANVPVIQWTIPDNITTTAGITVGFSRGASAQNALRAAIEKAEEALQTVAVSIAGNGSDVASGRMYVTVDYSNIFARAVSDAKAVYNNSAATSAEIEGALYRLAQAYGGASNDRFSYLENRYFGRGDDYGREQTFDTGYNGTGFMTFAKAHLGTM
jgi:hypothetical protein